MNDYLAALFVATDVLTTLRFLRRPQWVHPPVGVYERLAQELNEGRCHFVLFDFPPPDAANFEDVYYCPHMPLASQIHDVKELKNLLEDNKPAIVMLPPVVFPQPSLAGLYPDVRIEENSWAFYTYPVVSFKGATSLLSLSELTRLARGNQK